MNVVKRRLEESPQKREHTENDAAGSHSFLLKIPCAVDYESRGRKPK
jgi:hypothetical protein